MQIRTIPPVIACAAQSALISLRCRFSNVYENISSILPKNKNKKSEAELLIDNIKEARSELERAMDAFNELTDKAAVDYASYSIMAARARYAYLLTIAKKNNIKF